MLTEIGHHVDYLEHSALNINVQMQNVSQIANKALQFTSSYMAVNLGLTMITSELDLISTGLSKEILKLEQAILHNQVEFAGTHFVFTGKPVENIIMYLNGKGVVLEATYGFQPTMSKHICFDRPI